MDLEFSGEIWFWKGPSPWYFVSVPEDDCSERLDRGDTVTVHLAVDA